MSRDDLDPQLSELLHDAVAHVEPAERLGAIRARTSAPARRRPATLLAYGGAVLAAAAAVTAVAVVGPAVLSSDEPGPAGPATSPAPTAEPSATDSPSASAPPVAVRAVAGYYLGATPAGDRLYREFRSVESPDDGPGASLSLLTTQPADPDYRTLWPEGSFAGSEVEGDRITVALADEDLLDRPGSMTEDEARLSVQQVVYTLQAYAQERLPVEFTLAGSPVDRVLGRPTPEPVTAEPPLSVLSLVNLTTPEESASVGRTFPVEGVANSPEANVPWALQDTAGTTVAEGFFTAEGWMGERLFPFSGSVDASTLPSGSYLLVVATDDPSGGEEGFGAFTDTRTVVLD